jgi:LysM repeat protein
MVEKPGDLSNSDLNAGQRNRCPNCDSVVAPDANKCIYCGEQLEAEEQDLGSSLSINDNENDRNEHLQNEKERQGTSGEFEVISSNLVERRSAITSIVLIGVIILIGALAIWVMQNPDEFSTVFIPTETRESPTRTLTPTWTPLPSETPLPSATSTTTPVPRPTNTPLPPRVHQVVANDTLFSLSLRYDVSIESIAQANGISAGAGLQVSQDLVIPWPTATPPLERVAVEVGGETIVADPTNCRMYEIQGGDTFFGISARERVPLEALIEVNRLTEQSVLQPGDQICIPEILRGGVLPPTPGPSPSPTVTKPPSGPELLYPLDDATIDNQDGTLFLQWVAVKDLADEEWYMVELTDLTSVDSHPSRGFTRQTSFQVPQSWRFSRLEMHRYRWRVQIVQVTGEREDGSFIYTFGGSSSEFGHFNWLGGIPAVAPTPTQVPIQQG